MMAMDRSSLTHITVPRCSVRSGYGGAGRSLETRGAYTLLELMLAASISLLVMAGIGSFIFLIYRVQATSGADVYASGVARNILRQLEWDIQSIPGMLPDAVQADPTRQDTSRNLGAVGEFDFEFRSDAEQAEVTQWFYGDTFSLEFLAEPPQRTGRLFGYEENPEAYTSSQQQRRRLIRWGANDPDMLSVSLPDDVDPSTIVRAEAFVDPQMIAPEYSNLLPVPEILSLEFAFFDGASWLEMWDSEEQGGLPKAIEASLTLRLDRPQETELNPFAQATTPREFLIRKIIHLPIRRFAD